MNWQHALLFAAPGLPLALLLLTPIRHVRPLLFALLPVAPMPALAAALLLPIATSWPLPFYSPQALLVLAEPGRLFLGVAALLWSLAGVFACASIEARRGGFAGWWLATLGGNMLLFLAADLWTFYLAFALLSLATFGLVIHNRNDEAHRAGRVYLVLAVVGETCLLLGLLLATHAAGTTLIADVPEAIGAAPSRNMILFFLIIAFGIKAGLMPLHIWLPLAHPAAPVAASAVLSGAIVKAGIYGLLTFLPLAVALPGWSAVLVVTGFATAYLGILFGVVQERPKTVLAYSTLSQMGLLVAVLGATMDVAQPTIIFAAISFYALHHSLAKGALFLSTGVIAHSGGRWKWSMLCLATLMALAIAGRPFTGGALAKLAIKDPIDNDLVALLVILSAAGTTLLMLRFLQLARRGAPHDIVHPRAGMWVPFALCTAAALTLPWLLFPEMTGLTLGYAVDLANFWKALWPILLGTAVLAAILSWLGRPALNIPEGHLVMPVTHLVRAATRFFDRRHFPVPAFAWPALPSMAARLARVEHRLTRWPVAGSLLLCIAIAIAASLQTQG